MSHKIEIKVRDQWHYYGINQVYYKVNRISTGEG